MNTLSAIIFDFDGVIADTEPLHFAGFRLTLAEIGEDILKSQEKTQKEIETCGLRLKELNLRTELKKVSLAIKQAELIKDERGIEGFTKKFQEYTSQLNTLVKQKELI